MIVIIIISFIQTCLIYLTTVTTSESNFLVINLFIEFIKMVYLTFKIIRYNSLIIGCILLYLYLLF